MSKPFLFDLEGQKALENFASTPQNSFEERIGGSWNLANQSPLAQSPIYGSLSHSPSYAIKNSPIFSNRSASMMSRNAQENLDN